MKAIRALALGLLVLPAACMQANTAGTPVSASFLPAMRWDAHRPEAGDWTRALLGALRDEGAVLASTVPSDVDTFCPGYADAAPQERVAFWAGLFSVLAKHESTFNPKARGGGGQWIGLMQISPRTAEAYDCDLPAKSGLADGKANLACAVKIAASQVSRDGAIVADSDGDWRGIARDWAPMRNEGKRDDIAAWTSQQSYCQG